MIEEDRAPTMLGHPTRQAVLCLTHKASPRVIEYVQALLARGIYVDLFVTKSDDWLDLSWTPSLRIHALDGIEGRQIILRLERGLVFTLPRRGLRLAARAARKRPLRLLRRPVRKATRVHERLASAFHRRLFLPYYRIVRPRALARLFGRRLDRIDLVGVERIVATDVYSITLGWRLAKRYPKAIATTSLDL